MTARASDIVSLEELADRCGRSLSTMYHTWRDRVVKGRLPPPIVGDKPEWSRHIVEQFFLGALPPLAQEPRGGAPKRQPGRKPAAAPPPTSTFPLMRQG